MKILFLIPHIFIPPDIGTKNLTFNLLKYISKQAKCNLVLLVDYPIDRENIYKSIYLEFPDIQQIWLFEKPQGVPLVAARLEAALYRYHPTIGRYKNQKLASWLLEHTKNNDYDIIHFDMFYTAQYWKSCIKFPRVLVAPDAYSSSAHSTKLITLNKVNKLKLSIQETLLRNYEQTQYQHFHTVCTVAKADTEYLKKLSPKLNVRTVGIAVGKEYTEFTARSFIKSGQESANILCTCSGSISTPTVTDYLLNFIKTCYPAILESYPSIQLILLGRVLNQKVVDYIENIPSIQYIKYVPDYLSFLKQDWVYIYPQSCGSGLKTKVQQAMALGLPVVGSEQAFNGLEVENGRHCFICKTSEEFSHAISSLVGDRHLREEIGFAAAEHIRKFFSIEAIGENMMAVYRDTIKAFQQQDPSAYTSIASNKSSVE